VTAAEILPALEAAGVHLVLTSMGTLEAEVPDPTPPEVDHLLDEARRHRGEVLSLLANRRVDPAFPCLDCGTQLEEGVLLCPGCLEERHERRKVLTFYVRRRHPTAPLPTRPAREPCPSCQGTDWRLVSAGLWLCRCGAYWSPARQAEKPGAGTAPAPGIESGRPV
jgi:ribosomal protein L37AE/L43A